MLVIVLSSIFIATVCETTITSLRTADATAERERVRLQMAKAIDLLTREAAAAYNVDNSAVQRFQFDARLVDANGDGQTENRNNINYVVQSGDFQRVYSGDTVALVPDLTALTFTYLDSNGNATTNANNVRVMEVTMTAVVDSETISMAAATRLRNL